MRLIGEYNMMKKNKLPYTEILSILNAKNNCELLRNKEMHVGIVSRGYRGKTKGLTYYFNLLLILELYQRDNKITRSLRSPTSMQK